MLYEKDIYEPAKYRVSHGILVFLGPVKKTSPKYGLVEGDYVSKKIPITETQVKELEELICSTWKEISALKFDKLPEKDAKKCRACTFASICWE